MKAICRLVQAHARRCDKIGAEQTSHWEILFLESRDSSVALRKYP